MRLLWVFSPLWEILSKVSFTCYWIETLLKLLPWFCLQFAKVCLHKVILVIQLAFPLRSSTFLRFLLWWLLSYILLLSNYLRFVCFDLLYRWLRRRQAWLAFLYLCLIHLFINWWLNFGGWFLKDALKGDVAASAVDIILIFWNILYEESRFFMKKLYSVKIKLYQRLISSLQNIRLNFL